MPSKTSKPRPLPRFQWKVARDCSESDLVRVASELSPLLGSCDRVLLEGPMGVGKSTFARALLHALGVQQSPEGSPTFAIAHEYRSARGEVVHIDLYRLRSESEIEDAGIHSYFWDRDIMTITEWTSLWPDFEASLINTDPKAPGIRTWVVWLKFCGQDRREVVIETIGRKFS